MGTMALLRNQTIMGRSALDTLAAAGFTVTWERTGKDLETIPAEPWGLFDGGYARISHPEGDGDFFLDTGPDEAPVFTIKSNSYPTVKLAAVALGTDFVTEHEEDFDELEQPSHGIITLRDEG